MGITTQRSMNSDSGTQNNIGNINTYGISSDEVAELIADARDHSVTDNTGNNTITIDQDYIRVNPSETLTLPDSATVSINPGKKFKLKCTGDASAGAVTINRSGTDLIDGATSKQITTDKGMLEVTFAGIYSSVGKWDVTGKF